VIRATLDTNILASGAIARKGTIAKLFNHWRSSDFELVVSEHILVELERALRKPYFAARLDQPDREDFVSLILDFATVVKLSDPIPTALPDVPDNLILATALSGGASHLVSGDRALQRLDQFQDVQILSAHQFLIVIAGEQGPRRAIER
jgi:putative PIN family toxin of toxin-antitoxin system